VLALPIGVWRAELDAATATEAQRKQQLAELRGQHAELAQQRAAALDQARASAAAADRAAREARQTLDELAEAARQDREQIAARQAEVSELRVQLAGIDLDQLHAAIAALERELVALGELGDPLDARDVEREAATVERVARQLRDAEDEIARSRGALEHVGGAIVRDQITELDQAMQHHREVERRLEVEFDGWKLLAETLRSAESLEGQHLGRQLAGPVSQRFQQLTGGRYGSLELGAHLQTEGLHAAGAIREVKVLSAGTQDQLATLLRLCIAEQLNAAIVLDDHLSQSDPDRVAWFNDTLRTASQRLQIIVITCRPLELLAPAEMPAADESTRVSAAGLTRAIDLTKVIRRFAGPAG
jgi:exonuclease SbcC